MAYILSMSYSYLDKNDSISNEISADFKLLALNYSEFMS